MYKIDPATGLVQLEVDCGMRKRPIGLEILFDYYENDETMTAKQKKFRFTSRKVKELGVGDFLKSQGEELVSAKCEFYNDRWQKAVHTHIRQTGYYPSGSFVITRDKSKALDRRTSINICNAEWINSGEKMGLENFQLYIEDVNGERLEYMLYSVCDDPSKDNPSTHENLRTIFFFLQQKILRKET